MKKKKTTKKSFAAMKIDPKSGDLAHLRAILKSFGQMKILVIGDVGVDRYTIGAVERISPEAPVPIVSVQTEQLKLGLAANVADNIKALGGRPMMVGVIGGIGLFGIFGFIFGPLVLASALQVVKGAMEKNE